jgi:hypothetical protein
MPEIDSKVMAKLKDILKKHNVSACLDEVLVLFKLCLFHELVTIDVFVALLYVVVYENALCNGKL